MTDPIATPAPNSWSKEQLFFSGDEFFGAVLAGIEGAKKTVVLEAYIFAADALGSRVVAALAGAARRGLAVRVIVDGIGSPDWKQAYGELLSSAGVHWRIFNEPPWAKWWGRGLGNSHRTQSWGQLLRRLNTRDHRKLLVVDGRCAFLGGMNISEVHLESVAGSAAWRDVGVSLEGPGLDDLSLSFDLIWDGIRGRARRFFAGIRTGAPLFVRDDVLINSLRKNRKRNYRRLLLRIEQCRDKLWITSAYFVPPGSLLRAFTAASNRGVDVRVLVAGKSDVFFMPWVAGAFYEALIKTGAKIFEYQPRILHAKTIQGDAWAIVGSSNMNHRSVMRDMEIDVVLGEASSIKALSAQFESDLSVSEKVTVQDLKQRSLWVRLVSALMLKMRSVL
jgi:cardiolipin synthase